MFEKILTKVARGLVVIVLFSMIGLSFVQIILRNFFDSGIGWADVTVRHLVLWIAFLGAILASIEERHISLDLFSRLLPERAKRFSGAFIHFISSVVCVFFTVAAYKFVASERMMGEMLFAGIPVWWAQAIIPSGFALLAIIFFLRVFKTR